MPNNITNVKEGTSENARAAKGAQNATTEQPKKIQWRYPSGVIHEYMDYLAITIFDYDVYKDRGFQLPGLVINNNGTTTAIDASNIEAVTKDENNAGLIEFDLSSLNSLRGITNRTIRKGQKRATDKKYIYLPIPQQISDNVSVAWGEDTLNPAQAAAVGLGANVAQKPVATAKAYISAFKKGMGGSISPGLQSALNTAIGGQAANAFGANVSPEALITRATGQILQSNLELLFGGPSLRTFPFTYDFAPRDETEAQECMEIIRELKIAMSARSGAPTPGVPGDIGGGTGGLFIKSPRVFLLQYKSGDRTHPFLNKFKLCALTDLQVNYTGSGTYATYAGRLKAPVHMIISMTFKELNPIYAEDQLSGYAAGTDNVGGVGF